MGIVTMIWDTIKDYYNNQEMNVLVVNKNMLKLKILKMHIVMIKLKDPMIIDVICTLSF